MFHLTTRTAVRQARRSYATAAAPRSIRGGLFGFLLGVTTTGSAAYYYLLDEFTRSNNVVLLDLLALTESVQNLEKHVKSLEELKK